MENDPKEELEALVQDAAKDVLYDEFVYGKPKDEQPTLTNVKCDNTYMDTDDGAVFGEWVLSANDGKYVAKVRAEAVYQGEQDCWSWSRETHYTKTVEFDELEDFTIKVTKTEVQP